MSGQGKTEGKGHTMTTKTATGSQLVEALEAAWQAIRDRNPEVPEVVIITGSGLTGLGLKWGHFCDDAWQNGRFRVDSQGNIERDRKPEVFIGGERLGTGPVETLQTMLHEAAHALGAVRGVKTTSRQNRYHNGRFLAIARELGLDYEGAPDSTLGYSEVKITKETEREYADVIKALGDAIALSMDLPGWLSGIFGGGTVAGGGDGTRATKRPSAGSDRNNVKATCGCEKPRIIRVSRSVLELGAISCSVCGEDFAEA